MGMRQLLLILILLPSFASAQSPMFRLIAKKSGCTPDTDAQKFIDSTGIAGTEATAICNLVKDLKDSSLWSPMNAIYPFVGGTESTHKWNLKDPQDTDAAYRITFTGGWTHSSSGIDPNGTTGYANTFLNPNSVLSATSAHISIYSTENTQGDYRDMGVIVASSALVLTLRWSDGSTYYNNGGSFIGVTNANSTGYYLSNRNNSANYQGYKNGAQVANKTSAFGNSNGNIYIGAWNSSGTAGGFSNRNYAFATIGASLTAAEITKLNTIVERFNDALSRGVQ